MLDASPFYNKHIKNSIIAFGRVFSNIHIIRENPTDITKNQTLEIPLSYAPKEKWMVRIDQDPNLENQVHTVLPRMSFEITGYNYDSSRKLNRMEKMRNNAGLTSTNIISATTLNSAVITSAGLFTNVTVGTTVIGTGIPANTTVVTKTSSSSLTLSHPVTATFAGALQFNVTTAHIVFTPVPYNIDISLYILTKTQEDNLQILEQILPVFTPEYTVKITSVPDLLLENDVPIILNSTSVQDDYDGDFQTRRFVTTTLTFTLKLNLYRGIQPSKIITKEIIKFKPVTNLLDTGGAAEILTSTGTVPGAPIIDSWLTTF